MGIRKPLTADQKAVAADAFGAEGAFLSAGKKLLDNRHPAFRAVTAVRNRLLAYSSSMSLPYPEPGLRQHVVSELSRVQSVLDGLLVDRPRRNILRRPK